MKIVLRESSEICDKKSDLLLVNVGLLYSGVNVYNFMWFLLKVTIKITIYLFNKIKDIW